MRRGRSVFQAGAVVLVLIGIGGGSFGAGRSTVADASKPNPLALDHGVPVGVVRTPAGALAAADNYAAAGITASVDPVALRGFATAVLDPALRARFLTDGLALAGRVGPPTGGRVLGLVIAHRLERYVAGRAEVTTWALGTYWDGGVLPTQDWALVDVSLRWSGERWLITSLQESIPGPVPALVPGSPSARSPSVWDRWLSRMSGPLYGDG